MWSAINWPAGALLLEAGKPTGIYKRMRLRRVLQILISTAILEQGSTTTAELSENGVALEM